MLPTTLWWGTCHVELHVMLQQALPISKRETASRAEFPHNQNLVGRRRKF